MTYNYMPQGSIFEDIDGQLYCEVDLLKGIKRPLNRAEIISNYQPKSCLIENKDGEIFNLIDLLLSVGQNSGSGGNTQPTVDLQEVIDARTNFWGEEFETLKERLDADYMELAKDLEISRYYPYSGTGELSEIKHTSNGIMKGLYIEGNTINENGVRKSVGEESNKINILSKNSDGSKTSTKEILLPFNGGLKSLNGVCDVVEEREDGIYVIQRISEGYQVLTTPVEHKVAERDLNIDTYQDVTYVECENNIKPKISFVANGRVYDGQDVKVDGSKDGEVKNMVIKGQTYQNISHVTFDKVSDFLGIRTEITTFEDGYMAVNSDTPVNYYGNAFSKPFSMIKPNTVYTLVTDVLENTLTKNYLLNSQNADTQFNEVCAIPIDFKGRMFVKLTSKEDVKKTIGLRSFYNMDCSGKVKFKYYILEGDWTNKEVPSSIDEIESVGDKENNKISILSSNIKNLFNENNLITVTENNIPNRASTGLIKTEPNSVYYLKVYEVIKPDTYNGRAWSKFRFYNKEKQYLNTGFNSSELEKTITIPSNVYYFEIVFDAIISEVQKVQIMLSSTPINDNEPSKLNKKEILLPMQGGLKSLPNGICDTIEQREDGIYLVQRVNKYVWKGTENFMTEDNSGDYVTYYNSGVMYTRFYICDKFIRKEYKDYFLTDSKNMECTSDGGGYPRFYVRILKSKLNENTVSGFKQWLQSNPITVYYQLETPIETKLFNDLETFKNSTYLSFENAIKPEHIECEIPYNVDALVNGLLQENKSLQNANLLMANELEETKGQLEENNNEQIATQLDLDMRLMMLEMGDL